MRRARSTTVFVLLTVLALGAAIPAAGDALEPLFEQMQRDYLFGQYGTDDKAEQREAFDRVLATSQQVVTLEPGGARAQLWAAVAWGLYGMSHSMFASARQDVAGKIRHHATRLIEIDPSYESGAGYRLLGRLHTTVPRVPWVSMWIDRAEGARLLRQAVATSRDDPRNLLFLAEALLDGAAGPRAETRPEAMALLREAAAFTPRPDHVQEDEEAVEQAAETLEELGILEPSS